jgi:hypothetical protein
LNLEDLGRLVTYIERGAKEYQRRFWIENSIGGELSGDQEKAGKMLQEWMHCRYWAPEDGKGKQSRGDD